MATPIQRYQSKVNMSGESPAVNVQPEVFSAGGRLISDVGGALATIAEHYTDAQETQQKISATNHAKLLMSDVLARAQADPKPENIPGYAKEFENIRKQALQGITLKNAQIGFDNEFSTMSNDGLINLNKFQREKVVGLGTAAIHESLKTDTTDYLNATNHIDTFQSLARMKSRINEGVSKGFFSPLDGQKMIESTLKGIGADKVNYDLQRAQTPEQIDAIKQALLSGAYENHEVKIDEKQKLDFLNSFEAYKKKKETEINNQSSIIRNQNEMAVSDKLAKKEPIVSIDSDVDPNFKRVVLDSLKIGFGENKDSVSSSLLKKYLDINLGANAGDPTKRINAMRDFRNEVIANKMNLDEDHWTSLLAYSNPDFIANQSPKFDFIKSAIDFLVNQTPQGVALKLADRFMQSATKPNITPEMIPGLARQMAKEEAYKNNPDMIGKEEPTNYVYSQGNINVAYPGESKQKPDGHIPDDTVTVIRKSDNQTGKIPRSKFNAEKYKLA